jgi:hypothetical protein
LFIFAKEGWTYLKFPSTLYSLKERDQSTGSVDLPFDEWDEKIIPYY